MGGFIRKCIDTFDIWFKSANPSDQDYIKAVVDKVGISGVHEIIAAHEDCQLALKETQFPEDENAIDFWLEEMTPE